MKKIVIFLFLNIVFYNLWGQISLLDIEANIQNLEQEIKANKNDSIRISLSKKIEKAFENAFLDESFMEYKFNLKYISVIKSTDHLLEIISWSIPMANQSNLNFGFFVYKQNKKKLKIYNFKSLEENLQSPEMMASRNSGWQPILYYKIITQKQGRKTYYTLLGWLGKDAISHKKIIDILRFSNNGKITIGEKIILGHGKQLGHIEFEYNARSIMTLKYMNNAIVFDHLAPIEPQYKGIAAYYGPDGTYDGLIFEDGKWHLVEAIDIRNPKLKNTSKQVKHSY